MTSLDTRDPQDAYIKLNSIPSSQNGYNQPLSRPRRRAQTACTDHNKIR